MVPREPTGLGTLIETLSNLKLVEVRALTHHAGGASVDLQPCDPLAAGCKLEKRSNSCMYC